ncbi:TRAP transporter small permease [Nocardioides insulae]|uniref:TRAP transporter small permease n=1 Tax=Nocardioides insulae TaxID=394734 RepID=UPI0004130423|nr:TRAP transporter small permease [Nocardioides insulae]
MRFLHGLDKTLSIFTAIAVILMMLHIVAHALMRAFFNAPIYGTNELVAYWYLPVVALLGIPAAQLQREHISVTLVLERLNTTTAAVFKIFACVFGALLSLGFAWFGFAEAMDNMEMRSTAGVTDIITWPVYFLVPVVFILLGILYVLDILTIARTGDVEADEVGEHIDAPV